jgi:hypothetical protein
VEGGEDNEVLFGPVTAVARNSDGSSFLLDSQLSTVHVISHDGIYLRSVGREGEGPGEFRMATNVMLLPDGNVCVLQVMPARAVLLTPTGDAAGELLVPRGDADSHAFLNGGSITGDHMVYYLAEFIQKGSVIGMKSKFVRTDSEGELLATYWELLQEQDLAKVTFSEKTDASPIWAVGPDGRFYISGHWDGYAIEVINSQGEPDFVIQREYEPLRRETRDIARLDKLMESGEIPPGTEVSETHRDLEQLMPRENGDLWVLSSRGKRDIPENTIATLDVFDSEGLFVSQIVLKGAFLAGRDEFFVVGDCVYTVTNTGEFAGFDQTETGAGDETDFDEITVSCFKINTE